MIGSMILYFLLIAALLVLLYYGKIEGEDEHDYYKRKYEAGKKRKNKL